ncbi:MAG: hypothetical protein ACXACY_31450 [Candidatus Hodarchaeales archaeon]|jgi:hypothetical protein
MKREKIVVKAVLWQIHLKTVRFIRTSAIKVPTGEIIAGIEVVRDITERKKIEGELKRRVNELEEFYSMSVGRELRMQELKNKIEKQKSEIKKLESELSRYKK